MRDFAPKMADLRAKYQTHIAAILKIAGFEDADSRAATVLSLESTKVETGVVLQVNETATLISR